MFVVSGLAQADETGVVVPNAESVIEEADTKTVSDLSSTDASQRSLETVQNAERIEVSEKTTSAASGSQSPLSELPMVIATLFGLICAIFGLAWLARRYTGFNASRGPNGIAVHATAPVGARERVSLIEVNGQKILIGITSQTISRLHTFDESREQANSDELRDIDNKKSFQSTFAQAISGLKPHDDTPKHINEK